MGRNGVELGFWRDGDPMVALGHAIGSQGWVRDHRSVAWSADGSQHFVLITAAAFDWDGEAVAVMTTRDVTETERAKQEGDAILDNAVVGVCSWCATTASSASTRSSNAHAGAGVRLAGGQAHRGAVPEPRQVQGLRRRLQSPGRRPPARRSTSNAVRSAPTAPSCCWRMRGRAVDPEAGAMETGTIWVINEDITDRRRAELSWSTRSATPRPRAAPRAASWRR